MNRIALAIGDPNGIGPEITLKALAALPEMGSRVTVFGAIEVLQSTARPLGLAPLVDELLARSAIHDCGQLSGGDPRPGQIEARAGRSAVESASAAIQACDRGDCDVVVAAPHHETAVAQAGITFSGYPSLVERCCGLPAGSVFLMLVGGGLRIVHATLHESVAQALARLDTAVVVAAAEAGVRALARLGVTGPRIGIMGINPHASEGGLFGAEDERITVPAAERLRAQGLDIVGPAGGDVLLADRNCDLYLSMFHDQGHIPVKLLAPQAASALSIGARVLLSSVGHGSAMDIAGRGQADPQAMIRTLRLLA